MNNDFCTVNEIAERWNISPRWFRHLCTLGKILGAVQLGKAWAIPWNAEKPTYGRITTGNIKINYDKQCHRGDLYLLLE